MQEFCAELESAWEYAISVTDAHIRRQPSQGMTFPSDSAGRMSMELIELILSYNRLINEYINEKYANSSKELEEMVIAASEMKLKLEQLGFGARAILNRTTSDTYALWENAGGESLPQYMPTPSFHWKTHTIEMHKKEPQNGWLSKKEPSLLEAQLENLIKLAQLKVDKMHRFASKVGRRSVGDIINKGSIEDRLISDCAIFIGNNGLGVNMLGPLIRRIQSYVTQENLTTSTYWYTEGERRARWWLEEVGPFLAEHSREAPDWAIALIRSGWKVVPRTRKSWEDHLAGLRG